MRRQLTSRRQSQRLVSLAVLLAVFLAVNIEVTKWKVANFVLHNDDFNNLLQNNFLSQHQRSLMKILARYKDNHQRRLESDTDTVEDEEEALPVNAFYFGFFDQRNTEPTQEEYEGLLCQTKAYYEEVLSWKLGNDIFVHLDSVDWKYTPTQRTRPVHHVMMVQASLDDGTPIPAKDVNSAIVVSDMAEYIERFVWAAEPRGDVRGIFYETSTVQSEVGLSSDTQYTPDNLSMGKIALKSSATCPPNGYYQVILHYGFFPGFSETSPTEQEIHDMVPLSERFFTRTLQKEMRRKVQVKLQLVEWNFDSTAMTEDGKLMPLTVTFHLMAVFQDEGDAVPLGYVKEKLANTDYALGTSMMKDYIQQAVWEVRPFKKTTLWNVNKVLMHSKVFQYQDIKNTETASEEGAAPAPSPTQGSVKPQGDNNAATGGDESETSVPATNNKGSGSTTPDLGAPASAPSGSDESTAAVPMTDLELLPVSDEECREFVNLANTDLDRYLVAREWLLFVNYMTGDAYMGYPYEALPDVLQDVFESLAIINDEEVEAIDLLGLSQPDITFDDLNFQATTRADKICQYLDSRVNEAVADAPVETIMLNPTVDLLLSQQHNEPLEGDQDYEVLNQAFQNLVEKKVAPIVTSEITLRKRKDRRQLSRRESALQAMRRHLETETSIYIPPKAASILHVEEAVCRGADVDNPDITCYNAQGVVDVFLKGSGARSMADEVRSQIQKALDDSVMKGELEEELKLLDPRWGATTATEAPSAMPSSAPSVGPPTVSTSSTNSSSVEPLSGSPGSPNAPIEGATGTASTPTAEPMKRIGHPLVAAIIAANLFFMLLLCGCGCWLAVSQERDRSNKKLQEEETGAHDASLPDTGEDDDDTEGEHEEQPQKEDEETEENGEAQRAAAPPEEGEDVEEFFGIDEQEMDDGAQPAVASRSIGNEDEENDAKEEERKDDDENDVEHDGGNEEERMDEEEGTSQDETERAANPDADFNDQGAAEIEDVAATEETEIHGREDNTGAHNSDELSEDSEIVSSDDDNLDDDALPDQDIEGKEDNVIREEQDGGIGAAQEQLVGPEDSHSIDPVEHPNDEVQENNQDEEAPDEPLETESKKVDGEEAQKSEDQSSNMDAPVAGEEEAILGTEVSQENTSQIDDGNVEGDSTTVIVASAEGPADAPR